MNDLARNIMRVAVVGAGPAGLYSAVELVKSIKYVEVDLFDRLPVIGGLVRYGVSPDHFQRRAIVQTCERLLVASGKFCFYGNVELGKDIQLETLRKHYDAVILATGIYGDKNLDIAGEHLTGCYAASEIVGWYNGHPDFEKSSVTLSGDRAVIIGNGNVALDIARCLLLDEESLAKTDISDKAMRVISDADLKEVIILGRRGPEHVSFTLPEIMGLSSMNNISVSVDSNYDLEILKKEIETERNVTRKMRSQALLQLLNNVDGVKEKKIRFIFYASPCEIKGEEQVEKIEIKKHIKSECFDNDFSIEQLLTGTIIKSIGFAETRNQLPYYDCDIGMVPNYQGRALEHVGGQFVSGLYVCGWLKRGPSGVIGSNKFCAKETVSAVLKDIQGNKLKSSNNKPWSIADYFISNNIVYVDYKGWKKIDNFEKLSGERVGRPRIKLTDRADLLALSIEVKS